MPNKRYTFFKFEGEWLRGYDAFNHIASFGLDLRWRRKTAQLLTQQLNGNQANAAVLDLACGTGDMALAVRKAGNGTVIVGTDPSKEMLARGKLKLKRLPENSIYLINTVERLPFPDASFDAITCAFGLRNFSDLPGDLREMHRLLKPHGRVYALDFYQPRSWFTKSFLKAYNSTVFPLLGFLLTGHVKAYRYLFSSIFRFLTTDEFRRMLEAQGFRRSTIKSFFFGLVHLVVAER